MYNVLGKSLSTEDLQLTPTLCRAFFMCVFHVSCLSLSTLWVIGQGGGGLGGRSMVFVLYLLSERSYSPERPAGDLHSLKQPRANQVHYSTPESHKHAHIYRNKHVRAEKNYRLEVICEEHNGKKRPAEVKNVNYKFCVSQLLLHPICHSLSSSMDKKKKLWGSLAMLPKGNFYKVPLCSRLVIVSSIHCGWWIWKGMTKS